MAAEQDEGGVLGNLPRTRPAVQSPRRAAGRQQRSEASGAGSATTAPAEPLDEDGNAVEQLARAGAGLAAGVAVAGLRLAGRAAGELGRAVGRR